MVESSNNKRWLVIVATAVAVALAAVLFFVVPWGGAETSPQPTPANVWGNNSAAAPAPAEPTEVAPVEIGKPQRITVKSLGVDAPVIALGLAPDGSQAVPETLHETAWWELGSRPGQSGNGVIVGHAASKGVGVFDDLKDLKTGDRITVVGTSGKARFEVTETYEKPVSEFAEVSDDVYRTEGPPGLVLMTCGGWDGEAWLSTTFVHAKLVS